MATGESLRPNCSAVPPGYYSKVPDLGSYPASRMSRDEVQTSRSRKTTEEIRDSRECRIHTHTLEREIRDSVFFLPFFYVAFEV